MSEKYRNFAHSTIIVVATIIWAATVLYGGRILWAYKTTPNEGAHAPVTWPSDAPVRFDAARANLVVLAHPRCPCTRATIVELNHLAATLRGRVAIHVFFLRPSEFDDDWVKTASWDAARTIPGARLYIDEQGRAAERFGAVTSGQVILYGRDGRRLFSGGLTAIRGHVGEGAGVKHIVSLVTTGNADSSESLVFGCSLVTPNAPLQGGTL